MKQFFPKDINDLISNTQFRKLFIEAPLLATTGAYYGFPVCCIEFFCHGLDSSLMNSIDNDDSHPMIGTGYVPCPHCLDMSRDKKYFSDLINQHRFCPHHFPSNTEHNIDEDLHKFFAFISYKMYRNPLEELKKYPNLSYLLNDILSDDPIYLYYKGHKINVTAIGIKNKQDFGYMVENNAFCANQLENLLEWYQIQEAKLGVNFDYSGLWDCICRNEFEIISPKDKQAFYVKPENIEIQTNDFSLEKQSNPNSHYQSTKRNVSRNHFSMI